MTPTAPALLHPDAPTCPALTPRQALTVRAVHTHMLARGAAPTLRDLMLALGIRHLNALYGCLESLRKKGYVRWGDRATGGVRLVGCELVVTIADTPDGERLRDLVRSRDRRRRPRGTSHPEATLPPGQRHVLLTIYGHLVRHGRSPTVRELMTLCGYSSPNGVWSGHLKPLRAKGWLTWDAGRWRSIRLAGVRVRVEVDGTEAGERLRRVLEGEGCGD